MITFEELKNPRKMKDHYTEYKINYQGENLSLTQISQKLPKEKHQEIFEELVKEQLQPTYQQQVLVSYEDGQIFTLKVLSTAQMLLLQELVQQGSPKVQALSEAFYICDYNQEKSFVDVIHQLFLKQLFGKVNYDLPFNEKEMEYDKELFPNS